MTAPEPGAGPRSPAGAPENRDQDPVKVWTVLELLRWTTDHFAARGIESARLDAECLLAHALGITRLRLYLEFEKPVTEAQRSAFRELVRRRANQRVPVALLLGEKEFWSLPLRITPDVLVPRPETETLVTAALDRLPDPARAWRVLDLGTGSGAIALAIAHERPSSVITATDIAQEALKLAQENAEKLGVADRIRFLEGDALDPVRGESFDLVVSNPPYVAEGERSSLPPELLHEPERALFAGPKGLDVLLRVIDGAASVLEPGGSLALEHAPKQAEVLCARCGAAGLEQAVTHRDLGGRLRVTTARRPGPDLAGEARAAGAASRAGG